MLLNFEYFRGIWFLECFSFFLTILMLFLILLFLIVIGSIKSSSKGWVCIFYFLELNILLLPKESLLLISGRYDFFFFEVLDAPIPFPKYWLTESPSVFDLSLLKSTYSSSSSGWIGTLDMYALFFSLLEVTSSASVYLIVDWYWFLSWIKL